MQSSRLMRAMFHTVAPRYDFITRTFSYGMDRHWKRTALERAHLPAQPVVLDLASGTGDFSLMVKQQFPGSHAVAVDITERMLQLAHSRGVERTVCGDAGMLPFPDHSFDCVFVGSRSRIARRRRRYYRAHAATGAQSRGRAHGVRGCRHASLPGPLIRLSLRGLRTTQFSRSRAFGTSA